MDKLEPVPDFGEPWTATDNGIACRDGCSPGQETFTSKWYNQRRITACVNALAGRRPEKLQGFVEAVEKATVLIPRIFRKIDSTPYGEEYCIYRDSFHAEIYKLTDALAAFRGSAK